MKRPKKGSLGAAKLKCWDLFSLMIKLEYSRDGKRVFCYTCGALTYIGTSNCQGSHYWPKGGYPGLYFHRDNVRPCCHNCNINLEGNRQVFREKLIQEIGEKRLAQLDKLRSVPVKRTRSDYYFMAEQYKARIKELREQYKH